MLEGTRVYLNPDTLEIIWDGGKSEQTIDRIAQNKTASVWEDPRAIPRGSDAFSENLVKSVVHFVGSLYEAVRLCGLH